jgi:hypothetical protein
MENRRAIWKLFAVCILAVFYLVAGGGRQVQAFPPGVCPWGTGNPYCLDFSDCKNWCAQFPDAYPDESVCTRDHCCVCAY